MGKLELSADELENIIFVLCSHLTDEHRFIREDVKQEHYALLGKVTVMQYLKSLE